MVDGGYWDNSGIVSAIEWLEAAEPSRPDRVIFIEIRSSAQRRTSRAPEPVVAVRSDSALSNARQRSIRGQPYRNASALEQYRSLWKARNNHILPHVVFALEDDRVPLTWNLGKAVPLQLEDAWKAEENQKQLELMRTISRPQMTAMPRFDPHGERRRQRSDRRDRRDACGHARVLRLPGTILRIADPSHVTRTRRRMASCARPSGRTTSRRRARRGVFDPGKEYKAWIRFSNALKIRHDLVRDARGMAIKLLGVEGANETAVARLRTSCSSRTRHFSWPMQSSTWTSRPRCSSKLDGLLYFRLARFFFGVSPPRFRWRGAWAALRTMKWTSSPLVLSYFSQVPFCTGTGSHRQVLRCPTTGSWLLERASPSFSKRWHTNSR